MRLLGIREIGNRLLALRKKMGLTQAEMAERSGISDRTYADIERGTVNMRLETFLQICQALHVTPDELLVDEKETESPRQEELLERLRACPPKERETALRLLSVYLNAGIEDQK